MVDETRPDGERPENPRIKTLPVETAGDEQHLHGIDHVPNSTMFFVRLSLAIGGHLDSLEHPHSQENQEEAEQKKDDDFHHLLNATIHHQIEYLQLRNERLNQLADVAKENLIRVKEERKKIVPLIEETRKKLQTCGEERDYALKVLEQAEERLKEAQNLTLDAQEAFPDDALPKRSAQVTFVLNNGDRPRIAEIKVAVYMENGKYYITNPLTGEPQEITDEEQKKELQKELESGKKTYDSMSEGAKHQIEHYDEAASSFIRYALEADRKRAELEKITELVEQKKEEYAKYRQNLEDMEKHLTVKDREIEELEKNIAAYSEEIEKNRERIAALEEQKQRLDILHAERQELREDKAEAKEQLANNGRELKRLAREVLATTEEYYISAKAHDDYSDLTQAIWKNFQEYRQSTRELRQKGVAFSEENYHDPNNPESHAHLLHAIDRDKFGQDPAIMEAITAHDQKRENLRKIMREYYTMNQKAEELAEPEDETTGASALELGRAAVDTGFSNEIPLTGHITPIFSEATGNPPEPGQMTPAPNLGDGKQVKNPTTQTRA